MDLYNAIISRKSVRSFENRPIPKDVLCDILEYAKSATPLEESIGVGIELVECSKKTFGAPYYIVIYSEEKEGYAQNAGYIMQRIVMYLVSMGLGTCYKMKNQALANKDARGRKKVISVAFGYTKQATFRNPLEAKRLTWDELCIVKEEPCDNVYKLIEAIRLSPSAYNSQPWRMVVYQNCLHLYVCKKAHFQKEFVKYIDIGIARANLDMAAANQWIDISKRYIEKLETKGGKRFEYVISVKHVADNLIQ